MRKIVLFLLLLATFQANAQLLRTAVFDFNHPEQLDPPVEPYNVNGSTYALDNVVLKNQGVSLVNVSLTGIHTYIDTDNDITTYSLYVIRDGVFSIRVEKGDVIKTITLTGALNNLQLVDSKQGKWDTQGNTLTVNPEYREIKFTNPKGYLVTINKIEVIYETRSDILSPVNAFVDDDHTAVIAGTEAVETVPSFTSLSLTFDEPLYLKDSKGLKLTGTLRKGNTPVEKDLLVRGSGTNTIQLYLDEPLTGNGDMTVTIPSGAFCDAEDGNGFVNKALTYSFKMREPLNVIEVTPKPGKVESLTNPFVIQFDDYVHVDKDFENSLPLMLDGEEKALCYMEEESDAVNINFAGGKSRTYTDEGVWTITIPKGAIKNDFERFNQEIVLTYYIGVDPEDPNQPQPGDSEVMIQAKAILENPSNVGVGYPAVADDGTRAALDALVHATETPSDEDLKAAIGNYYKDPNVVMPDAGKWYYVKGVNASGNKVAYLAIADGKVIVTSSISKASPFKVAYDETGLMMLTDVEGNYLHVPTNSADYIGSVSKSAGPYNVLTVQKLAVEDVDSTLTFGRFSISGKLLAVNEAAQYVSVTAIDYSDYSVVDVPTTTLYCSDEKSSAFQFVLLSEDPTIPTATLSPSVIENNSQTMVLTINNLVGKIATVDLSKISILNSKSEEVKPTATSILTAVEGSGNEFIVHVNGLLADTYTMTLAEGTFKKDDGSALPAFQFTFTLKGGNSSDETLPFRYEYEKFSMVNAKSQEVPVYDTDLNNIILFHDYSLYNGMVADSTKAVRFGLWDKINAVITTAHFVRAVDEYVYEIDEYGRQTGEILDTIHVVPEYPWAPAVRLVLDEPIKKGSLKSGNYGFLIPAATLGDENFGKWLAGDPDIRPEDCVVNPQCALGFFYVNNEAAKEYEDWLAGIEDIQEKKSVEGLYDLTGRRLDKATKPGIYIKNGKKVYIK